MVVERDNVVLSDTEGGEKSAREQLKKANIQDPNAKRTDDDIEDAPAPTSAADAEAIYESSGQRGRIQRKRSFEEVEPEQSEPAASAPSKLHNRKRSRDSTAEEYALNNGQRKTSGERSRSGDETEGNGARSNDGLNSPRSTTPDLGTEKESAAEAVASPKTKRSRLHSTSADPEATVAESSGLTTSSALIDKSNASTAESKTDASQGLAGKIQPGGGFANSSSSSPFGALAGSKPPSAETSSSAFASSKFGALAGSSSSGFGALGNTTGGPGLGGGFGSGTKSPLASTNKAAPETSGSAFGGALGQQSSFATAQSGSAFGSGASGFASLGGVSSGGFGGGLGGTGFGSLGSGGLSSFASGKPAPAASSSKLAKPFGAAANLEDAEDGGDEEDDGAGFKSPLSQDSDKQDERFYAQDIETGEEGEMTEMTCRAKLYNFAPGEDGKKEWRERGVGILRLNVQRPLHDDDDTKTTARLLMRADGSHRVLLNTPVLPQIKFGQPDGSRPTGSYVYFMGTIDDKKELQLLQLKVKAVNALELFDKVKALQEEM